MGLQSWRNFVVIQHRDRDKLGTITSVHPPSSIDSVNLERKNIIFHPRFSSIKEEEKGLKQVGFKSLIHHSYRFFNKFIGRRVKNFYLLKGVTFSPCPFVPSNSFEKAENYWPPATCLRATNLRINVQRERGGG